MSRGLALRPNRLMLFWHGQFPYQQSPHGPALGPCKKVCAMWRQNAQESARSPRHGAAL